MNAAFTFFHQFAFQSFALDTLFIFAARRLGWLLVFIAIALPFLTGSRREKKAWFLTALALASAFMARASVEGIRWLYPVDRPFVAIDGVISLIEHAPTASFPSGHAAFYFALATVIFLHNKKLGSFFYAAAFLIGVSRVIAGVHWPMDIIAGAVVGVITALSLRHLARRLEFVSNLVDTVRRSANNKGHE